MRRSVIAMIKQAREFIPPLASSAHKGQAGKIGVVGGCQEYTGAPYYAAISALKVGADLSHVFCTSEAGLAIKSYSPELIVHPTLVEKHTSLPAEVISETVTRWFGALHALVVGPGLGRDEVLWKAVTEVIKHARAKELPLVIDGDGINLVIQNLDLISGYKWAVITPNVVEYKRLCQSVFKEDGKEKDNDKGKEKESKPDPAQVKELSKRLGNVTVVLKGEEDIISDGWSEEKCNDPGNSRRSGGQGDVLAGTIGTFLCWANQWSQSNPAIASELHPSPPVLAAFAACALSRRSGYLAFIKHKRATTTPNVIEEIGPAFEEVFGKS